MEIIEFCSKMAEKVKEIKWKLEVILAASDSTATLKPRVLLSLDRDQQCVLELTPTVLGELRYQVAEALKIVKQCQESPALKKN